MNLDGDWLEVSQHLTQLQSRASAAHSAALDSLASGNADAFIQCLTELSQSLAQAQAALTARPQAIPVPAALVLQMEQLRTALEGLWSLNGRLSAQAQRALAVLFPQDQLQAYSRLGGRRGMGQLGVGSGHVRA